MSVGAASHTSSRNSSVSIADSPEGSVCPFPPEPNISRCSSAICTDRLRVRRKFREAFLAMAKSQPRKASADRRRSNQADTAAARPRSRWHVSRWCVSRYGVHVGWILPTATTIQIVSRGAKGGRRSINEVSERRSSSFLALHARHEATTFSHVCSPPRDRGMTWSMFSAFAPQYWQRCPSRTKTARRESGARARYGTRT